MSRELSPAQQRTLVGVAELLRRFSVDFTSIADAVLSTEYIGNAQLRAIVAIAGTGPQTTRQLAQGSGMSRAATTKLVNHLEATDLVEISRDPRDRRRVLVTPTDSGQSAFQRLSVDLDVCFRRAEPIAKEIVRDIDDHLAVTDRDIDTCGTDGPLELLDEIARVGIELDDACRHVTGFQPPQGRQRVALIMLVYSNDLRPGDFAEELGLSSGGVSHLLDQLEGEGLVERRYGALVDRRGVVVTITDRGRAAMDAFCRGVREVAPELRSLFSSVRDYSQRPWQHDDRPPTAQEA